MKLVLVDKTARYYGILHLDRSASPDEIRQAYLDLVRVWHPDRFNSDAHLREMAEERLKEINDAYHALSASEPPSTEPPPRQTAQPNKSRPRRSISFSPAIWLRIFNVGMLFLVILFATKIAFDNSPA